jgi:hypothetical protein
LEGVIGHLETGLFGTDLYGSMAGQNGGDVEYDGCFLKG